MGVQTLGGDSWGLARVRPWPLVAAGMGLPVQGRVGWAAHPAQRGHPFGVGSSWLLAELTVGCTWAGSPVLLLGVWVLGVVSCGGQ